MKLIPELVKIALLLAITVLLGIEIGVFKKPVPEEPDLSPVPEIKTTSVQQSHEEDLKKMMEQQLASLFKFPESVKFKDTEFEYKRIYKDAGIEIEINKELEMASLCGLYSAQNGMGVYGAFEPFYAEVGVSNEQQSIGGEVWFSNDGSINKTSNLNSKYTSDGDVARFYELFSKNCGEVNKTYMGVFSEYEIGYDNHLLKLVAPNIERLKEYPNSGINIQTCMQSGASFGYCLKTEYCKRPETSDAYKEFCSIQKEICSIDDSPKVCEDEITPIVKEREDKWLEELLKE